MRILSDDPCYPEIELLCHAKVLIPVIVDIDRVSFGRVDRDGQPAPKTISLARGDGGPISPRVIPPTEDWLATTIREIEPGERYALDVVPKPPYPNRPTMAVLHIATGVAQLPQIIVRVSASFSPRIRLVPQRLTLPFPVTQDVDRKLRLAWIGVDGFTVTRAEVNVPGLSATVEEEDGVQVVILHAPTGYTFREGTFPRVTVFTDDPQMPTVSIPISFTRR